METDIITVNVGSASRKYALFRGEELLLSAHAERTERGYAVTYNDDTQAVSEDDYRASFARFVEEAQRVYGEKVRIAGAGVRIVAPGTFFTEHRLFDSMYEQALREASVYDPVHIPPLLGAVGDIRTVCGSIPIVAVSDSAFHSTLCDEAKSYTLPPTLAHLDIRRFGYHGIALQAIVEQGVPARTVVCHLGSGASVTALKEGKSIDTSMGYTPLEGLSMSSRVGDIDPGAVVRLMHEMAPNELLQFLYTECGLLGASGVSDDMRVLLASESSSARYAIAQFVYRIQKYIGAYIAILGGLDELIFSGTIGVRSAPIRAQICEPLAPLSIVLDAHKNERAHAGDSLHAHGAVSVRVVHADEHREVARVARELLNSTQ